MERMIDEYRSARVEQYVLYRHRRARTLLHVRACMPYTIAVQFKCNKLTHTSGWYHLVARAHDICQYIWCEPFLALPGFLLFLLLSASGIKSGPARPLLRPISKDVRPGSYHVIIVRLENTSSCSHLTKVMTTTDTSAPMTCHCLELVLQRNAPVRLMAR
jgi:hypothetical protein